MKEGEPVTRIVRPLRGGQITIPAAFREQLGITGDSLLQITLARGELRIKPVKATETAAGSPWLKELYRRFAPVRQEAEDRGEEEVNAVIDQAVEAVRERRA
jgi:bifunctional DNA-binding transcriptional regulator/antitoxin component of YhaV-PrlF toxin-antitoxin module